MRFTLQELNTKKKDFIPNQLHSTFVSDINIYSTNNRVNTGTNPATANVDAKYIDTKLSDFFEKANNSSKIVDENGEPRVMYHGSNYRPLLADGTFKAFDGAFGKGIYFTSAFPEATDYAREKLDDYDLEEDEIYEDGYVTEAFLNVRNSDNIAWSNYGYGEIIAWAENSNQIKSATDNIGTFDSNNPDIRFRSVEDLETIYSAVDRFKEQFKAVAPIVVIQLRKLYANASQKEFDEIAKTFKEASGMYDSGINKIIIFAENSNNAYTELLHENTHAAIYKLYRSNNLDSKFEHFIKDMQRMYPDGNDLVAEYYSGDEMIDELVAYTLSTFLQSKGIDVLLSKLSSQAQQEISTILNTIGYEKGRKQHTPGYAAIFATRENSSRNSRGQGDRSVYGTIHQESSTPTLSESQMGISKNERNPQGKEPITSFRSINPGESLTDYARAVVANTPETRFRALGTTRLNKYKVEKIFGGIWIRTKKEFAKFASAVENYAFEEDGEDIAYTDNFLYAYYWNIDGQPIPYASVYLNREQSQDIVNQANQEIKDGREDKRAKEYFDTAVKRYELFKNSDYANDGNNSSTPNRRDNMRLGNRLLRKGGYYNNPSLYVKTQRPDNSQQLTSTPTEDRPIRFRSIAADNRTADYALDTIEQATADYADSLNAERQAIIDAITPSPGDSLRTILSTDYTK